MSYITVVDSGNQYTVTKGYAITELIQEEVVPNNIHGVYSSMWLGNAVKRSPILAALIIDLECEKGIILHHQCEVRFY